MLEDYVVIDLEMTGLNPKTDTILEVAAVRVRKNVVTGSFHELVKTNRKFPDKITELTGITEEMLVNARDAENVLADYFDFLGEDILVGHNVIFDYSFLKQWAVNHRFSFERMAVDTLKLARKFLPKEQKKTLEGLCEYFNIPRENAHRALEDTMETAELFARLLQQFYAANAKAFTPRPLQYKAKKQSPATERQKKYLKTYAGYFHLSLPQPVETMTKSEASRLTDIWLGQYGRMP